MSDDEKGQPGVPPEILQVVKALNEALADEPAEVGCVSWAVDQHVEEACRMTDLASRFSTEAADRLEKMRPMLTEWRESDPLFNALDDLTCSMLWAADTHTRIGQLKLALVNHDKEWADA